MTKTIQGAKRVIKVISASEKGRYITENDAEMDKRVKQAVRAAVNKAEVCKKPIAEYDTNEKKAYIKYPDGRRVDV